MGKLLIEHHIDRCAECRKYISELAALSGTSARQTTVEACDANLERGTSVGRYVVDGWLGRGEMGPRHVLVANILSLLGDPPKHARARRRASSRFSPCSMRDLAYDVYTSHEIDG